MANTTIFYSPNDILGALVGSICERSQTYVYGAKVEPTHTAIVFGKDAVAVQDALDQGFEEVVYIDTLRAQDTAHAQIDRDSPPIGDAFHGAKKIQPDDLLDYIHVIRGLAGPVVLDLLLMSRYPNYNPGLKYEGPESVAYQDATDFITGLLMMPDPVGATASICSTYHGFDEIEKYKIIGTTFRRVRENIVETAISCSVVHADRAVVYCQQFPHEVCQAAKALAPNVFVYYTGPRAQIYHLQDGAMVNVADLKKEEIVVALEALRKE